jgi:hypothetical protein
VAVAERVRRCATREEFASVFSTPRNRLGSSDGGHLSPPTRPSAASVDGADGSAFGVRGGAPACDGVPARPSGAVSSRPARARVLRPGAEDSARVPTQVRRHRRG